MSWSKENIEKLTMLKLDGLTWNEISDYFLEEGFAVSPNNCRKAFYRNIRDNKEKVKTEMRFLTIDIETTPLVVYSWGTFDQNIPNDMIIEDWSILSFSAKWSDSDDVIYMDTRKEKNLRNDEKLVRELHKLLNEANVILSQNGVRFDIPKIQSRFKHYGLGKTTPFIHIDALKINRRNFKDTSNKLDFQTHKFCKKFKKSGHKLYPGNQLWIECLKRNISAFDEMKDYNQIDVLSLEELYFDTLLQWDDTQFNVFTNSDEYFCSCGSSEFTKSESYSYTKTGKFAIWTCDKCEKHHVDKKNLLSKSKRLGMLK